MINNQIVANMTNWRHGFHRSPGIRFDVGETARVVAEVLTSLGLEVTTGVGGSGVVGVLRKGSSSRSVGFRADMDALPIQSTSSASYRSEIDGRHHGCGHDGHTAMLLGAAQALSESGEFDGTVHFIFQPNEEEGLGAQAMIDDGLFEKWGIDEVYALHCAPGVEIGSFETRAGPMMTFEDNFEIRLSGIGGHASAPHLSDDVMVAGAAVVTALQTIVARSVSPMQSGVVSVTGFETDGSRNLLPSNVVIRGDTRGLDQEIRELIETRLREVVAGVADAHRVAHEIEYTQEFIVMENTPDQTAHASSAAKAVAGEAAVNDDCTPSTGSEDFARMLQHRPGCYVLIGNGTGGAHSLPWHNPGFDFNDEALRWGAEFWQRLAEMQLPVST